MLSDLYLLHYNNYYNRQVKKEDNLEDYQPYVLGSPMLNINFIPNDYVNTRQIINWPVGLNDPDYLLEVQNGEIKSRWFIILTKRTTHGQFELLLHRDVVADYYYETLNSPCFIEKALIPDTNDLIFNSEDMTFNQIKKSETLLKDETGCPWIVGYIARKSADDEITTFTTTVSAQELPIVETFSTQSEYEAFINSSIKGNAKVTYIKFGSYFYSSSNIYSVCEVSEDNNSTDGIYLEIGGGDYSLESAHYGAYRANKYWYGNRNNTEFYNSIKTAIKPVYTQCVQDLDAYVSGLDPINYKKYSDYSGKYVRVGTSGNYKYYQLQTYTTTSAVEETQKLEGAVWNSYIQNMQQFYTDTLSSSLGGKDNHTLGLSYTTSILKLTGTLVNVNSISTTIGSDRNHLLDAPYDMFCLPYSDDVYLKVGNNNSIRCSKDVNYKIINSLAITYGTGNNATVYDLQIVPYCPITNFSITTENGGYTSLRIDDVSSYYSEIKSGNNTVGYIYHVLSGSFQKTIEHTITINNYKIESQTDLYRLCSPNYNGIFEFNAAKNGGVTQFNVQCTYKPFSPYIKIFPNWGRLYGKNFSESDFDARGLICGGDFSIPIVNSAWATYQLQNKNYQNTFDRQIQNMEVINKYQRTQDILNALTGTVQGGVSGAGAGLMAGGPVGAIAGAGVGTLAAMGGGIADIYINEALRNEALDYTKDMFGYQLGNIKALPQSLSKTSAYNVDNKYFPFIEYYTCSDTEKLALARKIAYNGMTLMVIGKISDYINNSWSYTQTTGRPPRVRRIVINAENYIKGKLIRIEGINEDYHILTAIAEEIYKGVYINV